MLFSVLLITKIEGKWWNILHLELKPSIPFKIFRNSSEQIFKLNVLGDFEYIICC